ncbi:MULTISPECIES: relaxase/mobilization nuclease domain-containing protein [unclassified Pedobacter]|uniref:relaxase/mobilization nuclease domain-containing protein n=1 Tax=unclassified Pedobacter TaxID=2628915 RepID=UPI001E445627|nr:MULTISPECIES: relaxase/mobilization nuclease domain-containing protein [unclassified Pedobacter]
MIVKILGSSATFAGVRYNHEKMRSGKGELLKVRNFGSLMGLDRIGPQDYINYLKAVSNVNKRVSKPQFHAVISAKGKYVSKDELLNIAEKWMAEMGYGENPYLVIFHNDTENNHVHIVSTRIDKNGRKISSAFEKLRSIRALSTVIKHEKADLTRLDKLLGYNFASVAQVRTLLEGSGFEVRFEKEKIEISHSGKLISTLKTSDIESLCQDQDRDKKRCRQLKAIFSKVLTERLSKNDFFSPKNDLSAELQDFSIMVKKKTGAELIFHSKDNKIPYGYTIIDHSCKTVMKGSEVMHLRDINSFLNLEDQKDLTPKGYRISLADPAVEVNYILSGLDGAGFYEEPIRTFDLQEDIDDEAIHGRNRQRKGKARTNTR